MRKALRGLLTILIVGIVAVATLLACTRLAEVPGSLVGLLTNRAATSGLACEPPPQGFLERDLVGTWEAGVPAQRDTLTIREDGKYKQLIHLDVPLTDYESDWQRWWLEERESGVPYLHLQGMRLCAFNPDISCDQVGGAGHDFCRNAQVPMINEGILLVLGVPEPFIQWPGSTEALRGISLVFPAGSETSWYYSLREP